MSLPNQGELLTLWGDGVHTIVQPDGRTYRLVPWYTDYGLNLNIRLYPIATPEEARQIEIADVRERISRDTARLNELLAEGERDEKSRDNN